MIKVAIEYMLCYATAFGLGFLTCAAMWAISSARGTTMHRRKRK